MKAYVLDVRTERPVTLWRRLRIPAELTLGDLHTAVQATTGGNDAQPHRFETAGERVPDSQPLTRVFTKLEAAIDYVYGQSTYRIVADGLERQEQRATEDFACLAGDAACDVAAATERLRAVFVTISYHAEHDPKFTAWTDPSARALFTEAVRLYLGIRHSGVAAPVLRERARLQADIEEAIAADPEMRKSVDVQRAEGRSRAEVIDGLVADLAKDRARTRNQRRRRR